MEKRERKDHPLVSVVVPVYNAAVFLERTVASIQAQDYAPLEILLVDDGSRDDSLAVCNRIAAGDERVRVFAQENQGASGARNTGIQNALGEYISFVDSDDWIQPAMISTMVEAMLRRASSVPGGTAFGVQVGREEVDEEGRSLPPAVVPPSEETFVDRVAYVESLLMYTGDASFCTLLLPAAFLKRHLFPVGMMGEDFRLLVEMALGSGEEAGEGDVLTGILRLPYVGYRVLHRVGSATRTGAGHFSKVYIDIVRHADYVELRANNDYPQLTEPARRFGLYERLDYLLHVPIDQMSGENSFYQETVRYLRTHRGDIHRVAGLTRRDRIYLLLLATAPRKVRQIHWALRKKAILADRGGGTV